MEGERGGQIRDAEWRKGQVETAKHRRIIRRKRKLKKDNNGR